MEYDCYVEHGIITSAMVTTVMLLNDIPLVWHRLVANLEMNSYNQLGYQITKCIAQLVAFMQNVVKLAPLIKPCMILVVTLFLVYDG